MVISNLILSFISALIVVFAIVFEGKLKIENKSKLTFKDFIAELKRISFFGWILVLLMLFLDFGNNYNSIKDNIEQRNQYIADTLRLTSIIGKLNTQNQKDSIKIKRLDSLLVDNGLRSDSIRLQVVDNAVQAINRQNKLIEKEYENIFAHFQNEVEDNLGKILLGFDKSHIAGFADTSTFVSTRLSNEYILKYGTISSDKLIIDYLMETAEVIDKVNEYAELAANSTGKTENKKLHIRMFLVNVEVIENYLLTIYGRIRNLNSYKEYEKVNFNLPIPNIDRDSLKLELFIDYKYKTDMKFNFKTWADN